MDHEQTTPNPRGRGSTPAGVGVIRIGLAIQLLTGAIGMLLVYPLLLGIGAMAGYATAQFNSTTVILSVAALVLPTLCLLAIVQIGRTERGGGYLRVAVAATVVQILVLLPFYAVAAIPSAAALLFELVPLAGGRTRERIRHGSSPERPALPEQIVLPSAAAALAGLLVWNAAASDVEVRHPEREFDGAEAPARLEAAIEEALSVVEEIDRSPPLEDHRSGDTPCSDGAGRDDDWSEHRLVYRFEGTPPRSGPGLAALEAMREHLPEHDWEITSNEPSGDGGHHLYAVRHDGVRLRLIVAEAHTILEADSGCVENPEPD
ncbi:hypothetical protein [Glycomyces xiaoerkulensis]|uniref:hypothetical protein n=1 Tax=Glycomyces xiaoerkulensis TaxID=2038139 RepID=UPI000C268BFD|nr:hypothetical protein [Glycomyces xiaoerkulensis]